MNSRHLPLSASRYSLTYKALQHRNYSFVVRCSGGSDHLGNTSPNRSLSIANQRLSDRGNIVRSPDAIRSRGRIALS